MRYYKVDEMYGIEVFVVNTSDVTISDISFTIKTIFKNDLKSDNDLKLVYSKEQLGNFMPNDVFVITITGNIPFAKYSELEKNTADDINIEVLDLNINGEQISNDK